MSRLQSSCSPFHFFPPQKHIFFRVSKCGTRRDRGWNIIHFSCLTTTQARNFAGPNGENRPEKKERTEGGIRLCFKEQQRRRRRSKQDSVVAVHLHCMNEISIEKACQRGLVCLYMLDKSTSLINLIEHEALTAFCLINRHNGFAQRSAAK